MDRLTETQGAKDDGEILDFMLNGGMSAKIHDSGGAFRGISLRQNAADVLMVVRADFDGQAMVAFVGAATMGQAVIKLEDSLFSDVLRWRVDRFAK